MMGSPGQVRRVLGVGRQFAMQVTVSVVATLCASALFTSGRAPPAPAPSLAGDTGKSARRIADGVVETTVLRYDSQQQAALASLASFTPISAPMPSPVVGTIRASAPKQIVTVLPPPRPAMTAVVVTASPSVPTTTANTVEGWRVAGIEIPGSSRVRRFVPTGADLAHTGDVAWAASANAVKKVAGLGSLFGL